MSKSNLSMLRIISDSIREKNPNVLPGIIDIDTIHDFFDFSIKNRKKFNFAYLLYYIFDNVVNDGVAKRKTTSRDFEDIVAILFNGKITDETKRFNDDKTGFYIENETITSFAKSNKREKSDVDFDNGYKLSVKTIMSNNNEINFGSFEKTTLFGGFGIESFLNERKGMVGQNMGLGSKPRLLNLLRHIESVGEYEKFKDRFNNLFSYVFSDDLIVLVKNKGSVDLYLIKGVDFVNLLKTKSASPEQFTSVVNRWEGNSIRMDRSGIFSIAKKISIDFDFIDSHVIGKIMNTENVLSQHFFNYIHFYPENRVYRDRIINECNKLLDDIDENIIELI